MTETAPKTEGEQKAERRIADALATQATTLDLSGLGLQTLPEGIGQLSQLQTLSVANNALTALPEGIGQLSQLQNLYLHDNALTALPEGIGQLSQLQNLSVWNNQLTALPEGIGQLSQLQNLSVWNNQLTALPEGIGQLSQLRTLSVSGNQLTALPEGIGQLSQLQNLSVDSNALTVLPEGIGQLSQLQNLYVDSNALTALPEGIGQLSQLRTLSVSGNQLTALPEGIGQLSQLQNLYVDSNALTALPEGIGQLSQLQNLYLHDNAALGVPPEVLGPTWHEVSKENKAAKPADILAYYFRARYGGPLNEAKLILVGFGAVGKTSLVNRLVYKRFKLSEAKTEGIQITPWPLRLNRKEEVRLNIWDFGGQEIMHATHQFFLTERSLYLLVLTGRQGHEEMDADYWLNLIQSFGGASPVIVVLNKIKEHPFDVNRRALQQKYPAIRAFVETDCKEKIGLRELENLIKQETDQLEHLRAAFPASWLGIKTRLAGMAENYIGFERYRQLCADQGEADVQAQDTLAVHLHSLGIALNYRDDLRLRDTHVLNPHWVTNGIYLLLNAPTVAAQKGEVRLADLTNILPGAAYPSERHPFLIELMRKFELCFPFADAQDRYLIPELLDRQQPAEAAVFQPAHCLNFQYHYPILPEGLLPRFVVRSHALIDGHLRWRTGVILIFEENRALVKADAQEKRIYITVDGPSAGRRRLLAVIRAEFEHIHRSFKFEPQEMVPVPDHPDALVPYRKLLKLEESNVRALPEVIGDRVVELNIQALLNGVDLEGTRRRSRMDDLRTPALQLFYSYAHKDERQRDELETHLKLLQRQGLIDQWHDRRISAGDEWKGEIDANLERADIILLLVSNHFLASDYCYDVELKRALERHAAGKARVIPVIIRDVNWRNAPFAPLQALPKDGKAVNLWPKKDTAWRNVAEGIERVIQELRTK